MKQSNYIALENALGALKDEMQAYTQHYDGDMPEAIRSLYDTAGETMSALMSVLEDERPAGIPVRENVSDLE